MALQSLPAVITLLIALSMATERAVEIIKSIIPWLDTVRPNPVTEGWRRATIQSMAVVFGIIITYITWPIIAEVMTTRGAARDGSLILALGLLSSGGSAFWNSLLGIVLNVKVMKDAEAKAAVQQVQLISPIAQPAEGRVP
jgi:hypothetical protein